MIIICIKALLGYHVQHSFSKQDVLAIKEEALGYRQENQGYFREVFFSYNSKS